MATYSTYFNLSHGTMALDASGNFLWPYDIDVCFESVADPIAFSEGVGHAAAGCAVSAAAALEPQWRTHFDVTNGQWLIPYIEKLAQGISLPREEMLGYYKKVHGKLPASCEASCTLSESQFA